MTEGRQPCSCALGYSKGQTQEQGSAGSPDKATGLCYWRNATDPVFLPHVKSLLSERVSEQHPQAVDRATSLIPGKSNPS